MLQKAASSSGPRIEWLDSLRGIASLLVMVLHYFHHILLALVPMVGGTLAIQAVLERKVLSHTLEFYQQTSFYHSISGLAPFIYGYWDLGKIGVISFFFISGYVIAYSLNRSQSEPIKKFVLSRFFRLYPVFWVSLVLMIVCRFLSGHYYSPWHILANITMFNKFILVPDINGVAWTLQIELTFYILAAIFFMWGLSKRRLSVIGSIYFFLLIALVMALLKNMTGIDFPLAFPLGLSVMFSGWYWRLSHELPGISKKEVALVFASFLPVWWFTFAVGYAPYSMVYFNSYVLGMGLVLFFALCKVQHPVLKFLGNISYAVYLVHDILGMHVLPWLMSLSLPFYHAHIAWAGLPFFLTFTLTILVATLLHYYVEKPCIALGKELSKRLSSQQSKEWQLAS